METPVIFQEKKTKSGYLICTASLNDPRTLNALSLDMIKLLYQKLIEWAASENVACVILKGEGEKAFCAGGNIRSLFDSIKLAKFGKNTYAEEFFAEEYRLDHLIHCFPKPLICLGNGVVMGGGIGLMSGASHRIVTETSVLAMPEITIGLFPDVGSSWFLSRMPDGIGEFIGMTGTRMNASDAIYAGLADYIISGTQLLTIEEKLNFLPFEQDKDINQKIIRNLLKETEKHFENQHLKSKLKKHQPLIANIITHRTPDKILTAMLESDSEWINKCGRTLKKGCPITAWIVKEQIKRAKNLSLENVFRMEFDIAIQCTRHTDLYEGIRALLVDKDNTPQWADSSLSSVTPEKLNTFFSSPWKPGSHPLHDLTLPWSG